MLVKIKREKKEEGEEERWTYRDTMNCRLAKL